MLPGGTRRPAGAAHSWVSAQKPGRARSHRVGRRSGSRSTGTERRARHTGRSGSGSRTGSACAGPFRGTAGSDRGTPPPPAALGARHKADGHPVPLPTGEVLQLRRRRVPPGLRRIAEEVGPHGEHPALPQPLGSPGGERPDRCLQPRLPSPRLFGGRQGRRRLQPADHRRAAPMVEPGKGHVGHQARSRRATTRWTIPALPLQPCSSPLHGRVQLPQLLLEVRLGRRPGREPRTSSSAC